MSDRLEVQVGAVDRGDADRQQPVRVDLEIGGSGTFRSTSSTVSSPTVRYGWAAYPNGTSRSPMLVADTVTVRPSPDTAWVIVASSQPGQPGCGKTRTRLVTESGPWSVSTHGT